MKAVTLLGEVGGEVNVCLDVRRSHMKLVNQSQDYTDDIFESATVYLYAPLVFGSFGNNITPASFVCKTGNVLVQEWKETVQIPK